MMSRRAALLGLFLAVCVWGAPQPKSSELSVPDAPSVWTQEASVGKNDKQPTTAATKTDKDSNENAGPDESLSSAKAQAQDEVAKWVASESAEKAEPSAVKAELSDEKAASMQQPPSYLTGVSTSAASESGPRVLVVSVCKGSAMDYCHLTKENHQRYAAKHGYEYKIEMDGQSAQSKALLNLVEVDGDFVNPESKWDKMRLIQRSLEDKKHDFIFWIDADAIFMNMDQSLENLIAQTGFNNDLLISLGPKAEEKDSGNFLNSGVMMFKTSDWSTNFVKMVIEKGEVDYEESALGLVDQPRIIKELLSSGDIEMKVEPLENKYTHVTVVRPRVLNSLVRNNPTQLDVFDENVPCFIAHVAGETLENRLAFFNSHGRE